MPFRRLPGFGLPPFTTSCIVLALYTSAYCTEIVRGAIDAVPMITRRAARSLGLTWGQDMAYVVFPWRLRVALPSWIGLTLGVLKDCALVLWLGLIELLRVGPDPRHPACRSRCSSCWSCGAIYFLLSFPIARLGSQLEKRWREND